MTTAQTQTSLWWIAINGPSVAACTFPAPRVQCRPTPQMLIGYPSEEQQQEALMFFLTASIPACKKRLAELEKTAKESDALTIIKYKKAQRPSNHTSWELRSK